MWAPSRTRVRVCRLQLLLALASAVILGSESRGTHDDILLSQFQDSPDLEGQVPVFISPGNRVAQLYSQVFGSLFVASYDSQGYGGGIRTRLHAGGYLVRVRIALWLAVYLQSVRLGAKPLEGHDHRFFFLRLNPCGHNPYVTSFLTTGWVCVLWICFVYVTCT
jgi:hypothetical protein